MRECFVVSPIGEENSDIRKNADQVLNHIIIPVCEKCDFSVTRVDQLNQSDCITQTIIDKIRSADLVIADMTTLNPNVFYEMGYRACLGKPMIHIKCKGEKLPFDISSIRVFEYDIHDLDCVADIKNRLEKTILSFSFTNEISDEEPNVQTQSIIPILYDIQDSIDQLKQEIHNKDIQTIQTIVESSKPVEDISSAFIKVFMHEIMSNPNAYDNLMKITENSSKKSNIRK